MVQNMRNHSINLINRTKGKTHLSISIDTDKVFEKIQYTFMTKIPRRLGRGKDYLNIIKVINKKLTANIIINGKNFSFKIKNN